jgi:myo-inositol 2-dehydrogenase/D-chiro-inositol 1-dehydrogenase
MTIRAGIVGLGFMGHRYAQVLAQRAGVTVSVVADARPDLAAEVAAGVGARVASDALALASADDVDAVFVCTPEDAHADVAVMAFEAGKHVLIEKPITHDLASAARVREAAQRAGTIGMVGHILRFEARWAAAARLIADGRLGDVVSIATRRVGNLRDQEVLRGRTSIPLYYGVHDLDIVNWFAGRPAVSIQAQRTEGVLRAAGFDIDDLYCAILRFEGGILATAELGWHIPPGAVSAPSSGVTVVGTQGWLRIEQGGTGLEAYVADQTGRAALAVDVSFWPDVHGRTSGALVNELEHFLDRVRTGGRPLVTLDDGIEALRLSLAMEEAASSGSIVDLTTYGAEVLTTGT